MIITPHEESAEEVAFAKLGGKLVTIRHFLGTTFRLYEAWPDRMIKAVYAKLTKDKRGNVAVKEARLVVGYGLQLLWHKHTNTPIPDVILERQQQAIAFAATSTQREESTDEGEPRLSLRGYLEDQVAAGASADLPKLLKTAQELFPKCTTIRMQAVWLHNKYVKEGTLDLPRIGGKQKDASKNQEAPTRTRSCKPQGEASKQRRPRKGGKK
jgi:hypothetical protein